MHQVKRFYTLGTIFLLLVVAPKLVAQTEELPVPAPAKTIASEERTILEAISKPKERSKKAVELAENRLKRAEEFHGKQDYAAGIEQLGRYQGLLTHTMAFLKPFAAQRLREPFRNIEVALRGHIPRIEGMRRQTPVEYAVHIRGIGEYVRSIRAEALNAFFDDTVIPDNTTRPDDKKNKETKPANR
jgi:hypothetical protein